MTKQEALLKLKKEGYYAVIDNSVLTVIADEDSNMKNVLKDVKLKLINMGYTASFGIRQHKISAEEMEAEGLAGESDNEEEADLKMAFEDAVKEDTKAYEAEEAKNEEDYLDEEDDENTILNPSDMDMLLNEDSVQFSLEDFGIM